MVDRLLRLISTLLVSTVTTERAFSAMKLVKTGLRNRMGDDFLRDYMIVYIEKEIAERFTSDDIIDLYDFLDSRRVNLYYYIKHLRIGGSIFCHGNFLLYPFYPSIRRIIFIFG
jgi:hAT family C-terminal dimerisation region